MYKHYVRTNQAGEIIAAFSTAFEDPQEGDILVAESEQRHFQPGLVTPDGLARWVWKSGKMTERTDAELAALPAAVAAVKDQLCAKIEGHKAAVMRYGFDYPGGRIQGDDEAQSNLMAWVLLDSRGAMTYPKAWRRADNTYLPIPNAMALESLAAAMGQFKDGAYLAIFQAKDSIRAASTVSQAQAMFDAWCEAIN